jgi:hypothetical protein
LDVTLALQYLVADGQLTLHGGMPKSGLMGFTDPAPHIKTDGAKQLMIVYQHKVRFFRLVMHSCVLSIIVTRWSALGGRG